MRFFIFNFNTYFSIKVKENWKLKMVLNRKNIWSAFLEDITVSLAFSNTFLNKKTLVKEG